MKKIIAILAIILSISSAQAFLIEANCNFNQAQGQCAIFNQSYAPIYCQLFVQGQVYTGEFINESAYVTVYPGTYSYASVYAFNPMMDPLVFVRGNALCQ